MNTDRLTLNAVLAHSTALPVSARLRMALASLGLVPLMLILLLAVTWPASPKSKR
jgi:hypothetical protein